MDKYYEIEQREMPLIPLRGLTVFPNMVVHFDVGRDKSVKALENASMNDSEIFLSSQKDPKIEDPNPDEYYHIGTVANIKQMIKMPGGSLRVLVEGLHRAEIVEVLDDEECLKAEVKEYIYLDDKLEIDVKMEAAMRLAEDEFAKYVGLNDKILPEELITIREVEDPNRLADLIASLMELKVEQAQSILEDFDVYTRLENLATILLEEIEILEIEDEINKKVRGRMNRVQKEYYLKEQLRTIQSELGDDENIESEVEEYIEKIGALGLDEEIEEKLVKEAERLLKLSPHSAETGVIRTYLDWIIDLPWNTEREEKVDIKYAKDILNEDHYGLKDVKERILEFIAIRKLTNSIKGPIICLVGPPGVGKTSIAKSVARALNRDFIRMSLGGMRDEAEIRGHRRTYVGAMPGKIISSIKKAKSKNPVFLLDEIDKIGNDFRGDPASALLEVLDPEQNSTFSDHFLEVPFDLSKTLFITTANTTSTIPGPLLDRMELIPISSYTEEEKLQIAMNYLLPRQIKAHGLDDDMVKISEEAVRSVITHYTREAGVRNLERELASICRKAAKRIVGEDLASVRINVSSIEKYLGIKKYRLDRLEGENQVGLVNGLAWTSVGGTTLTIEVNTMKGKGKVQLTGKLGDVMKESAMAGVSYIRSNTKKLGVDEDFYENRDIHIHVPEGAIPKDGPSAGISMATAVLSALTNKKVRSDVAMTGEVTLRGRVLAVGGIKEKVLAAHRLGIKKVILPRDNEKDLEEIPSKVKNTMEFVLVEFMDQVVKEAFVKEWLYENIKSRARQDSGYGGPISKG